MAPRFFPSFGGIQPQPKPKPRPTIAGKGVFGDAGAGKSGTGGKGLGKGGMKRHRYVMLVVGCVRCEGAEGITQR